MLEPSPLWAYVLLAGLFSCHPLLAQNAGSRAEWPFIEAPTFSARGSLGGKDVKVKVTPTDVDLTKRAPTAARTLRTGFPAARSSEQEVNNLTLPLPVSKKRRVGYTVNVSLGSPAERDIHLQLTGKLRSNPRTAIRLRSIKGSAFLPSSSKGNFRPRRTLPGIYEFSKDEGTTVLVIPKGATSTSFTVETAPSPQVQDVELIMTATTLPRVVLPEPPLGAFSNGKLPRRGPGTGLFQAVPAFPNLSFTDPSAMIAHPTQDKFFVSERGGRIYLIDNNENTTTKTLQLDLSANVAMMHDSGLYNFVLHPNFAQNGYAYLYYTWKDVATPNEPATNPGFNNKYLRLSRFTYDFASGTFTRSSEQVLIQFRAVELSHRGGGMTFGSDGFLYLAIGEQLIVGSQNSISSEFLSGIVRLDVDKRGGNISHPPRRFLGVHAGASDEHSGVGYFIPSDNPFLDTNGKLFEEFYCVGTRNPYRMTYDAVGNRMWYGEVGDALEELNIVEPAANFQYPFAEGQNGGTVIPDSIQLGLEAPATVALSRNESICVVAGFVYRGEKFPFLKGKLLAGDYGFSTIWAIDYDPQTKQSSKQTISGLGGLVGFGEDPRHGEVYCFSGHTDGGYVSKIYKLRLSLIVADPPATLSATGVFANLATMEPAAGVRAYSVNMPLWSDGANKQRWIGLPSDGLHDNAVTEQITFSAGGNYRFPNGTIFAKHFELAGRRIETRLLVNGEDANWYGVTYRWRADGSDADIVPPDGLTESIPIDGVTQTWQYPSRQQCFSCHTSQSGFVLGFRTSQLNATEGGNTSPYGDNYLTTLSNYGYFDQEITIAMLAELPRAAQGWNDPGSSLTHKVKSYLDSNCSHCHQPNGPSGRANWDGRLLTSLAMTGLLSQQPIDALGVNGSKLIMPGVPQGSTLLRRLNSVHTPYAMPPIAKNRVDDEASLRVAEWIRSLKPNSLSESSTRIVRSAAALDLAGSFLYAVNIGGAPVTVGDVHFTSDNVPGVSVQAQYQIEAWGSTPNLGNSQADTALATVFQSIRFSSYPEPVTVTMSGLVPGKRYKLQVLFMERCCDRGFHISVNGVDYGEIATLMGQGSGSDGTAGSAWVYEFPATSDVLTIKLSGIARLYADPILSGFTLEDLGDGHESWDADGDGLLDSWELMYAGDRTVLGNGDADNDGQPDAAELAAGTNPRAADSFISASLAFDSADIILKWDSQLGTRYRVLRSPDLSDWIPSSSDISGTGGIMSWRIPLEADLDRSFFRIETVPPEYWSGLSP